MANEADDRAKVDKARAGGADGTSEVTVEVPADAPYISGLVPDEHSQEPPDAEPPAEGVQA